MAVLKDFKKFNPRRYLSEQYKTVVREEEFILKFLHDAYQALGRRKLRIIEVGGGPTIYQLLSASKYAKEIVFTDFLQKNLDEVRAWKQKKLTAFDWRIHAQRVADFEHEDVKKIERRLRTALRRFLLLDIFHKEQTLGSEKFDIVSSHFCVDSITDDRKIFLQAVRALTSLVAPRGVLIMSLLKGSTFYEVGDHTFPAYSLDEREIKKILKRFGFNTFEIQSIEVDIRGKDNANICVLARR